MLCGLARHLGIQLVNIQPSLLIVLYVTVPVVQEYICTVLNIPSLQTRRGACWHGQGVECQDGVSLLQGLKELCHGQIGGEMG